MCALVLLFTAYCSLLTAWAQSKPADTSGTPTMVVPQGSAPSNGVLITPAMKTEDQLRLRSLQYEEDKKLLEMQRIEARYKELQELIKSDESKINDAVRESAVHANADLTKYILDLDSLKFVPRPASQPVVNQSTKPPEVKPK